MYVVEVIEPKRLKKNEITSCFMCQIDYPKEEYKTLRENKKLIYFKWNTKEEDFTILSSLTLCHGCLFKMIKKISPNKEKSPYTKFGDWLIYICLINLWILIYYNKRYS